MIPTIKAIWSLLTGKPDEVVVRGNVYRRVDICKISVQPTVCTINGWRHELVNMDLEIGYTDNVINSQYRKLDITAGPPLPPELYTVGGIKAEASKRKAARHSMIGGVRCETKDNGDGSYTHTFK